MYHSVVADRLIAFPKSPVPNSPKPQLCCLLPGERNFVDMIKLRVLNWGDYTALYMLQEQQESNMYNKFLKFEKTRL